MNNSWNRQDLYKLTDLQFNVSEVIFDLSDTKYKYVERIGTGAYGIVCQAQNSKTGQNYAIKKIKNPFNHKVTLVRALREIRILNHFNHKNIINIIDIFMKNANNGQDVYVVFDLMESDLHKIITSKQFLSDDHIRYFMYQILCGVNYIHSASVIHRDLKPANILVNSNCHLKIADFGMARSLVTSLKHDTKFSINAINFNMTQYVMTRWYRAPELLMGQLSYNTKIDLWSCGCILAELYLQKPLFRGDNMINQLKEIIQKMGTPSNEFRLKVLPIVNSIIDAEGKVLPTTLNQLIPKAPNKVIDLLSRLLVYDPDQRLSAAQALKHIFFLKYKNPLNEETCQSIMDLSFEENLKTVDVLKDALINDILSINFNDPINVSYSPSLKDNLSDSYHLNQYPVEIQNCKKSDSPSSERTLSADSGKELGYAVAYFDSLNCDAIDYPHSNRLKTVSQFTKNKLINSIHKPKSKVNKKIVTAAQRQKERKKRKLELKNKRNEKILSSEKIIYPIAQEQLSDLDKALLKKWEKYNFTGNEIESSTFPYVVRENGKFIENFPLTNDISTKSQSEDIEGMSAGLSALLLLDEIIEGDKNAANEKLNCNSQIKDSDEDNNLNLSSDNFDLMFDLDSIALDMNILESFSYDLLKVEKGNNFN